MSSGDGRVVVVGVGVGASTQGRGREKTFLSSIKQKFCRAIVVARIDLINGYAQAHGNQYSRGCSLAVLTPLSERRNRKEAFSTSAFWLTHLE